jgi:hypothetical protein
MEISSDRDLDAEDDARMIAAAGYVLVQMKVAKLSRARIERFLQTVIRDILGEEDTRSANRRHISEFNVVVG